jgi:hypothetical protein
MKIEPAGLKIFCRAARAGPETEPALISQAESIWVYFIATVASSLHARIARAARTCEHQAI